MTPVNREALELEIGVFAGLVADLDEKDNNALGVLESILDRLSVSEDITPALRDAFAAARVLVKDMISGKTKFADGYASLCETAEEGQRWLKGLSSEPVNTNGLAGGDASARGKTVDGFGANAANPGTEQVSSEDIAAFVSECRDYLDSAGLSLVELEKDSTDRERLNEVFRCFHNIKGAAGFLALSDVQRLSHSAESLMEEIRSGRIPLSDSVAESGFQAIDMLGKMLDGVEGALAGNPYVQPEGLDTLVSSIQDKARQVAGTVSKPVADQVPQGAPAVETPPSTAKPSDLVRVSTSRLDSLVDAVGELVIANSMVSQEVQSLVHANPLLARNMDRMNKIIRELQELATGVRMITLEGTFRKMIRVVRDIAARSGTLVDFAYSGGDTEIDRNMVEEMSSPLVHLIRNAVDHGLESSDERKRLGKSETGKVRLSASHQGGSVVIRLEDDGRGLNRQKILEKAVLQGLVKPGVELSDKEVYQLIYSPGFSTAPKVTEVSGRGVGMDIVKKAVEGLHGRIDISTAQGSGTVFTIRLPLTMAIIEGMVVSVAGQRYIVPVSAIQESLRPVTDQIYSVAGRGEMLLLRGSFVPLVRLHRLFSLQGAKEDPCSALVIIINDSDQRCAVLADDLVGQQQVVVKPLDGIFRHVEAVSGAAIVGDGTVSLILDPGGLIQTSKGA